MKIVVWYNYHFHVVSEKSYLETFFRCLENFGIDASSMHVIRIDIEEFYNYKAIAYVATDKDMDESRILWEIIKKSLYDDPTFLLRKEELRYIESERLNVLHIQSERFFKYIMHADVKVPSRSAVIADLPLERLDVNEWVWNPRGRIKREWHLMWEIMDSRPYAQREKVSCVRRSVAKETQNNAPQK